MSAAEQMRVDGVFDDIPEDRYHADPWSLSVSRAKLLLPPSCPALFRHQVDHGRKPKKVWDFGHVAHRLILGKGAEIAVLDPAVHGLKKDGTVAESPAATATWKAAAAEARERGAVPIHLDEYRKAEAMADRVLNDPVAGPLFTQGVAEQSLYATDPMTGVQLRGRVDWRDGAVLNDVKTSTTANPAELQRKFWMLGYHMQAAWYMDLLIALGIAAQPRFLFVVVDKEPPHLVTVVEYDDDAIREGRRLNRQAINLYAQCRASGVWPAFTDTIAGLSLPGWALRDVIRADADELITELEGIYQS